MTTIDELCDHVSDNAELPFPLSTTFFPQGPYLSLRFAEGYVTAVAETGDCQLWCLPLSVSAYKDGLLTCDLSLALAIDNITTYGDVTNRYLTN